MLSATKFRVVQPVTDELSPRVPDAAENAPIVEISEQLDDRRVYIGKAIEHTVTQPSEKPALDDANSGFDFRLVAR